MNTQKPVSKPDDLIQSNGHESELTDKELGSVVGGAKTGTFVKIEGVDGESKDHDHKG